MSDTNQFLKNLDKKLWTAADKLRANLDAAVYKHAVLGLIFLKYVSDAFEQRQQQVRDNLGNLEHEHYPGRDEVDSDDEYQEAIREELEVRDDYVEEHVFWVLALARVLVSSEKFIEQHSGKIGDVSVYGQESNPTTWRLAAMNMAIRGIDFNFGKQPANSFTNDLHPDLRADYVMANPPFNMKEWWDGKLEGDPRWEHGDPPNGNANFGWLQHMLYHLAPKGSMALLLANGSMSSNTKGEREIRETIVKADLVECMVALPGQLFTNTQIPACIWFLTKTKQKRGRGAAAFRDRTGEVLFIDARKLGYMVDRVLRAFTDEDTQSIVSTFHAWKRGPILSPSPREGRERGMSDRGGQTTDESTTCYRDIPGFCKSATLDEIAEHGYVLTPGRYVGAEEVEDDGVPFAEKMEGLTRELATQFHESEKLQASSSCVLVSRLLCNVFAALLKQQSLTIFCAILCSKRCIKIIVLTRVVFQKPQFMVSSILFAYLWVVQVVWDSLHSRINTVKSIERFRKSPLSHGDVLFIQFNADRTSL